MAKTTGKNWLNPRRKRFWIIVAVLLYTAAGFLVVPLVVKNSLITLIEEDLNRTAHVDKVRFNPYTLRLGIQNFEMSDTDGERLAAFGDLLVDLEVSSLYRRAWTFREIRLEGAFLFFELLDDNESRLSRLLADAIDEQPASKEQPAKPMSFFIEELALDGGSLDIADQRMTPAAEAGIRDLRVNLTGINNREGVSIPVSVAGNLSQGGQLSLAGNLVLFPEISFSGNARTQGVPLSLGQPYLQQSARILIEGGELESDVELSLQAGQEVAVSGTVRIPGLEMQDTVEGERLLGWHALEIEHFSLENSQLDISKLLFRQPFGRFIVLEDQTTNLTGLVIEDTGTPGSVVEEPTDPTASTIGIVIGSIHVDDGAMAFSDLSLPLPFATHITRLNGSVSTISSSSSEPASVNLEGQVSEFGLTRIEGTINVLDPVRHVDIALEFRNLLMSELSPYTVQFAGRRIDEGKLDLKLDYLIESGELLGENDIVISELLLGDKVEHPDAASLPLGLAVALLKDANGVIDIELPIRGDLNNPEFRIGGIIRQAIVGLITKVVSAPFSFLGRLIGVESEDLGDFKFLAGRADLAPPEMEKINQLEKALLQRPELKVEISGVSDPAIDIPALQAMSLRSLVITRMGLTSGGQTDGMSMLDPKILKVLESLFVERFQDMSLETFKAGYSAPPADQPAGEPVLDELAYASGLNDRLAASELISDQDLAELANKRAEAIRSAFLANAQLDQGRISLTAPRQSESEDGEWVTLELTVASK